jgi:hypothetical protein
VPEFQHALIVGGTGMLLQASAFVAARARRVTLVARGAAQAAAELGLGSDAALPLDWRHADAFGSALRQRAAALGAIDLALLWLHDDGQQALEALLRDLAQAKALVVHVLGSADADPGAGNAAIRSLAMRHGLLSYVIVVLGSTPGVGGGRRWLTDAEISAGTIAAIRTGRDVMVGDLGHL